MSLFASDSAKGTCDRTICFPAKCVCVALCQRELLEDVSRCQFSRDECGSAEFLLAGMQATVYDLRVKCDMPAG
jgi:hypothetical protein